MLGDPASSKKQHFFAEGVASELNQVHSEECLDGMFIPVFLCSLFNIAAHITTSSARRQLEADRNKTHCHESIQRGMIAW